MSDQRGWLTILLLLCAAMAPLKARSETHALIMTISNYQIPGVPPLKGVAQDGASAAAIARKLGVKDANMVFLRDGELTWDGMNAALDRLRERIAPNDDVFIYYSGHGGRTLVHDPEERCAESLITVDGTGYVDATLEKQLKALGNKANKMVVFLDACHSGGVTTRAVSSAFSPKYYRPRGMSAEACATPVNVLKRSVSTRAVRGAENYVYIAAAQDNEVSLDEPGRGGIATQAWLACVNGRARDLDGSGGLSAQEVQACAQELIDTKLRNVQGFTAHHIQITGNARAVLGFSERPAATPVAVVTPVVAPTPVVTPPTPVVTPPTPVATPPAPDPVPLTGPAATLADIYAQRDDRRTVTVEMSRPKVKIGQDRVEFTITSSDSGYLYLLMVGSDGKTFDVLFPNQLDRNNLLDARQPIRLPRPNWELTAGGPAGTTRLLAIVADAPRDLSKLPLKPAGPFSIVEANPLAARDIQLVTNSTPAAATDECQGGQAKRNLSIAKRCSNAYGAALVAVEEVP